MAEAEHVYGYAANILRINLNNREIWTEPTSKYARDWLGASGMAIKILYDELKPWVTPHEPANRLIIGSGALIGTPAPGANKISASTLGPMTGGWASGHSDSYLAGQLKYAGYDLLVIEGKAHTPVYLWIHDGNVEIRDASHLWGKTTWETLDVVRKECADPCLHTMSIGPAGENLVRGGCLIQDKGRAIGRCGTGAVMGSKNLKTVVAKGTGGVKVADPKRFMAAVGKCQEMSKRAPVVDAFNKWGSLSILSRKQEICGICYKNFQETCIPDELVEIIDPKESSDRYRVSQVSFPGCLYGGCGRTMDIVEGPYAGLKTEACQWEVVSTLQTRLAIAEPTFMYKANAFCNQLGLDVDMAGSTIGWAMECFQRGIIDKKDTDGLKLEWGDAGVALEVMRKIAYREGFGNILAEGCARASDIIGRGSSQYCMHIKKQDLYENIRASNGWGLGTTTSTRGGGHTTGAVAIETVAAMDREKARGIFGLDEDDEPGNATAYKGRAKMVKYTEALTRVLNSFGVCLFQSPWLDLEMPDLKEYAELYSAATGWETSVDDLKKIAERQLNLEKAFNLRYTNFGRNDDMPTPRDLNEPIPTGNLAGWKIDTGEWNRMLDEYYELHGWDKETGFPTKKVLTDLALEYVADHLQELGKLR